MDLDALEAELGADALVVLRDKLLARVPVTAAHPAVKSLDRAHVMSERRRAAFDAAHQPPKDGPTADALQRGQDRQRLLSDARAAAERLGRYYAEGYRTAAGAILWRVQDRYMSAVAYFALDDPRTPALLDGYASKDEAIARILRLDAYFRSIGCSIGPRADKLSQSQLVAADIQAYVPPIVEHRPRPAKAATPRRRIKQPGRNTVHRIIPDAVWYQVAALIPAEPTGKRTSKPRTTSDRTALAGILLYLRSTSGWHSIPPEIGCSPMLCRKRLEEWKAAGAWPQIEDALYEALDDRRAVHWDKAYGEPFATKKARIAVIRRAERYREDHGLTVGDISRAVFRHGTTYRRILDGEKMLMVTHVKLSAFLLNSN